jgi:hypothetical protein
MLIIVLAKESLSPHISEVSATYTGVGLMGIMASVSVCYSVVLSDFSLRLSNTSIGKQRMRERSISPLR